MKLVTFLPAHSEEPARARHGALVGDEIVDLVAAIAHAERASAADVAARYGADMLGLIERQDVAMPVVRALVEGAARLPAAVKVPLARATLLAPIPRPPSMRDGYAFRQHVETARRNRGLDMIPEFDEFPVFYFTNHQAVIGPGDFRVMPRHLEKLDFELEAAIVVGRRGRNLSAAVADDHVFGLTIMNDLSARTLQMEEMKLSLGPAKGKDFATAIGPWLVTLDELEDKTRRGPHGNAYDLAMRAYVNGVQVSAGNVAQMNWTFAQILERASYGVDLYPGEVIGSGTVGTGCFLELNGSGITKNQWLQLGDVVALEIDRLGRLENRVVAE
ncbi:MAG: fumarylacetoacetate hydrolase family protein [Deltaproteobacteria bacterium]|nr:fumarylacetoacetate hydrolase family protein [Deltaproteobacteria bacterium]